MMAGKVCASGALAPADFVHAFTNGYGVGVVPPELPAGFSGADQRIGWFRLTVSPVFVPHRCRPRGRPPAGEGDPA